MGGFGSTRWGRHRKKEIVERTTVLDLHELARQGCLNEILNGCSLSRKDNFGQTYTVCQIVFFLVPPDFSARIEHGKQQVKIPLETTTVLNDIDRWWWHCPSCNRRVVKLYLLHGTGIACRLCHNLTYKSCQVSHVHEGRAYEKIAEYISSATGYPLDEVKREVKSEVRKLGRFARLWRDVL